MAVQSQKVFTVSYRLNTVMLGALAVLTGLGLIFLPEQLFALLAWLLPWGCVLTGTGNIAASVFKTERRRKRPLWVRILPGTVLISGGVSLWIFDSCRPQVLWILFIVYLLCSAYHTLRPVWARAVAKQIFWRYTGVLTTWGFTLLLFMKPRSEFSTALLSLGFFAVFWGIFQLLLPPPEE